MHSLELQLSTVRRCWLFIIRPIGPCTSGYLLCLSRSFRPHSNSHNTPTQEDGMRQSPSRICSHGRLNCVRESLSSGGACGHGEMEEPRDAVLSGCSQRAAAPATPSPRRRAQDSGHPERAPVVWRTPCLGGRESAGRWRTHCPAMPTLSEWMLPSCNHRAQRQGLLHPTHARAPQLAAPGPAALQRAACWRPAPPSEPALPLATCPAARRPLLTFSCARLSRF